MPLAAALALGAIVAPPDAAAATAVLRTFPLPRRTMALLQGESLLNDVTALLIFTAAVAIATRQETSVNVLAFLLMGLQARTILGRLENARVWEAMSFGVTVLATVIVVRILWVMVGTLIPRLFQRRESSQSTTMREAVLISWCGMRGMVTLATAFALPSGFPHRDVIVLSALIVVLGSLMLQGGSRWGS